MSAGHRTGFKVNKRFPRVSWRYPATVPQRITSHEQHMHLSSIYNDANLLDFDLLAAAVPALRPFVFRDVNGAPAIDFEDPEALRQLAFAFLRRDFDLSLVLPNDRLCPGVRAGSQGLIYLRIPPHRYQEGLLDYALWISDIASRGAEGCLKGGLDIGTGASAIYALLLAKLHPQLHISCTEADQVSFDAAAANVQLNGLQHRIGVHKTDTSAPVAAPYGNEYDFSVCNPPFYSSAEEITQLAGAKGLPAYAACTGAPSEMIIPGGEVAFIKRMLADGLTDRVRWASSLVGKLSSVADIVAELKRRRIDNYALGELQQGQTRRWVVAWSSSPYRLPDSLARSSSLSLAKYLPAANSSTTRLNIDANAAQTRLAKMFAECALTHTDWIGGRCQIEAVIQSWSRLHRRKQSRGIQDVLEGDPEPILRCRLELEPTSEGISLHCFWDFGRLRIIWQSFIAHCRRVLKKA